MRLQCSASSWGSKPSGAHKMSVLGLDVGTSTCKGVVLSADGSILAQEQYAYADAVRLDGPRAELPPSCFEDSVKTIVAALAARCKDDPIRAIAVSSHGETLIPIGADGKPLADAMLSMDRRCQENSDGLTSLLGQETIYSITGSKMHPQFPVPKVMYLQQRQPELARRAVHYDTANDYVYRILGCPGTMDYSIASRFGGFDVRRHQWSKTIFEAADFSPELFSKAVCAGTVIGEMPRSLAASLGLTEPVLLVAGGHDQPCAALAIGGGDQTLPVSAGSYECAVLSTAQPLNTPDGFRYGLNSYCHVLPDRYATLAFFVSGMMVKWYLDTFCTELMQRTGPEIYAHMERNWKAGPTGICFTPHIFGAMNPEWSEHAAAKISGLTANATKADLYKAVLEGTCCELDLNVRVLEKLTGPIGRLAMSGGGTRSEAWMQLRADITGKPVAAMQSGAEASCLGAAMLAGLGAGIFKDPDDARSRLHPQICQYEPQQPEQYAAQKAAYLALHSPGLLD